MIRIARPSAPGSLAALAAAPLVLVSACSSGATNGTGSGAEANAEPGKPGGTAVVAMTSDPDTLMPWKATQFQAVNVLGTIYGTLTEYDKDLGTVPGLAEKWEPSADGKTLTLTLRKGVKFADGSDFDSADVKFSLDAIRDEKTAAVARSALANVTGVTATDPSTVTLALSAPDAALPAGLASVNVAMLPSETADAAAMSALETTPNGTGPFTFESRTPSQSVTLKRNDAYWGEKALLDGIEFRVVPDENAIVTALKSGNVHLAAINDPLVARTAEGGDVTVTKTPQLSYHALQLKATSTTQPALADLDVRLAISCAVDRQQVLDTAAYGEGEVTGPITAPEFKSDPTKRPCPKRDVAKAKELLAKAGKPTLAIKTIVSQGEYATSVNEAQNLKSQLAEAGITLDLEVLDIAAFVDRWVAGDFEAAVALNGGRPDPDTMYGRYFTSKGNLQKVAGYSSPELDALFAEGKATQDEAKRKDVYAKVSQHLEDNAAWVWLFTGNSYTVASSKVGGFVPMSNGSLQSLRTTTIQ